MLQGVAKDSAQNLDVKWILVSCRIPQIPQIMEAGGAPASHLQVHSTPLSQGRSPRAAPGKAVTAQRAKPELSPLLPSRASLGATLLRAAQSSCSAGEDLALQFMAGAHTSQRTGADRRGCVHSRTRGCLFCPPQAASLPGARLSASRLLQQERKHGSRSQGLASSSSTAGIDSLFGLT